MLAWCRGKTVAMTEAQRVALDRIVDQGRSVPSMIVVLLIVLCWGSGNNDVISWRTWRLFCPNLREHEARGFCHGSNSHRSKASIF